jgi:hypothetical protein
MRFTIPDVQKYHAPHSPLELIFSEGFSVAFKSNLRDLTSLPPNDMVNIGLTESYVLVVESKWD